MALRKRVEQSTTLILEQDDALDRDHPDFDWAKHFETGDLRFVPVKDGCAPSVFSLRRLTRRQFEHVTSFPDGERRYREAVAYGLESVTHYGPPELHRTRTDFGERITDEHLDELHAAGVFTAVGLRVLLLSTLNP